MKQTESRVRFNHSIESTKPQIPPSQSDAKSKPDPNSNKAAYLAILNEAGQIMDCIDIDTEMQEAVTRASAENRLAEIISIEGKAASVHENSASVNDSPYFRLNGLSVELENYVSSMHYVTSTLVAACDNWREIGPPSREESNRLTLGFMNLTTMMQEKIESIQHGLSEFVSNLSPSIG